MRISETSLLSAILLAAGVAWLPSKSMAALDITLQAESMPTKTTGQSTSNAHNLWSNGYIEQSVNFPASGRYRFEIRAQSTVAARVMARFQLRIDGASVAEVQTNSTSMKAYVVSANVSAGSHRVAVAFINDAIIKNEDRNLIVDYVRVIQESTTSPTPVPTPVSTPVPPAATPVPTPAATPVPPSATPIPSNGSGNLDVTLQAETMPTKTAGQSYGTVHNLWSNGYIEQAVNFPASGNYTFEVRAESSVAQGVMARFQLRIDGVSVAEVQTDSTSMKSYSITQAVTAGSRRVAIAFINDANINGEDRNLIVDYVRIRSGGSTTTPAPTPTPSRSPASTPVPATPTPAPSTGGGSTSNGSLLFGAHPMQYAAGTIKPQVAQSAMDDVIRKSYDLWKSRYVAQMCGTGRYVIKGGQPGKLAVSEGLGYGMLIVVVMAGHDPQARTVFDGLHLFTRDKMSNYSNMMAWVINSDCSKGDNWPAVDGDLDMAMALLMAHRQWGSNGSINYLEEAKKTINAIKTNIVKNNYIAGGPAPDLARTSDFMLAHFRAFQKYTGDATWTAVLDKSISLLNQIVASHAPNTGLQPDFIENANTSSPKPVTISRWPESEMVDKYAYNACRNPWRFGTDVIVSGDARSKAIVQKMMTFFRNTSGGQAAGIKAGYQLNGTVFGDYTNMSFQAPVGVGAMVDSSNQAFLNTMWNYLAANTAGGYYDHSIQLISMMVMSGNWWQP